MKNILSRLLEHTYMSESCAEFEDIAVLPQAYLKLMSKFRLAMKDSTFD